MPALTTPICDFGWKAPSFDLQGTDGINHNFPNISGKNGSLVMFICNHCPYVKSVIHRIVEDCKILQENGIGVIAVMSNDVNDPKYGHEDSFDNMKIFSTDNSFSFPYVYDETQEVGKKYDAVCTPDFFGFNNNKELQYRGRLEASQQQLIPNSPKELLEAMLQVAKTGKGPGEQIPSIGCSIKWKS
jgi:thiol-disulfide isomerase/thioredoxin|tara:strand:- start:7 stop:567 length:561 start_codon:yes stop_codon:yes gene_type:complete